MKSMKMALVAAMVLFTAACNKKDDNNSNAARLKRMEARADQYTALTYNSQNLPTAIRFVDENLTTNVSLNYNNAGKLTTGTMDNYKLGFSYKNGLLDSINFMQLSDGKAAQCVKYTYQNERVQEMMYYTRTGNMLEPGIKTTYQYAANGDLQSSMRYYVDMPGHFALIEKHTFEYDAKPAAIQAIGALRYFFQLNPSAHNVTKELVYDVNDKLRETHEFTYTYGKNNSPATSVEKVTYRQGTETTTSVTYSYE